MGAVRVPRQSRRPTGVGWLPETHCGHQSLSPLASFISVHCWGRPASVICPNTSWQASVGKFWPRGSPGPQGRLVSACPSVLTTLALLAGRASRPRPRQEDSTPRRFSEASDPQRQRRAEGEAQGGSGWGMTWTGSGQGVSVQWGPSLSLERWDVLEVMVGTATQHVNVPDAPQLCAWEWLCVFCNLINKRPRPCSMSSFQKVLKLGG